MPSRQSAAPNDDRLLLLAMQNILHCIAEGVHIIDAAGHSILYNRAMEHIEGLSADEVLGKHLLEVFPGWVSSDSTLLTAVKTGRTIDQSRQSYLNFKKKRISTVNSTFPIISGKRIIGAVEIARNFTEVNQLSERIVDLQQKLINPPKSVASNPVPWTFNMLLGHHPSYLAVIGIAHKAAKASSSILIEGETGTGKELFAQSIHNESSRKDKPFIAINCAALPDTLLESLLFGTCKGSYTGAEERPGFFEQAHGGTLLLDEINSMSLPLQAKLLRALQEGTIRRVGGLKDLLVDVRIIALSNEPLDPMMKAGTFRKDLYYRLNVIKLQIPALRERPEDIPLITEHFLDHYNRRLGKDVWMLSPELQEAFAGYDWVGNVRELQNVLESAMTMVSDEHVLGREHIPAHLDILPVLNRSDIQTTAERVGPREFAGNMPGYLEGIERDLILKALEAHASNISRAAGALGISRQNLQYKMKRYSLVLS